MIRRQSESPVRNPTPEPGSCLLPLLGLAAAVATSLLGAVALAT